MSSERPVRFESLSGIPVEPLYTPESLGDWSYAEKLGRPGEYPFTRGVYPTMYRGRLWTMRMFAGFGRPEDTNERFKYLLAQGQTGLSTAFDMPALMGYDADHPRARGEVGKEGVSISTLDDFQRLFADIPLGDVTTSMTINCTASVALAMYLAIAEQQGVAWDRLGGTMQNDMLKEFIAQKEWICPPDPAVRIVTDMIEFTAQHVPRFNPVSISGYHIREAGATAVQELAFTLADGLGYVEAALARRVGRRRVRAAPVVLLRHPQRLLRGDRQAAGGPADLGPLHEGEVWCEEAGVDAAAHAYADGRCLGYCPTTPE